MGYEETIAAVDLFSRLARSDLERIAKTVVPRKFEPGHVIVKEGDRAVAFYIVMSGKVEARKGGTALASFGPGRSFGDMSLLDGYPRSTDVVALEETECLVMTHWDFTAELKLNPSIALALLPILSMRIRKLEGEDIH